ncbi:hypothetical protein [Aquabacterium sp. OR-4]|uniref:hypothetical protein n=1 Tax=Aquabacterium sp. OR-4 TaxID=2978127 RepID=UPI0021B3D525|nr:hypothetical protein [Aquabacterium sp. OR-4]MDT7838434.1 hypothetical protein [Aquabacterium sp. OR-4]
MKEHAVKYGSAEDQASLGKHQMLSRIKMLFARKRDLSDEFLNAAISNWFGPDAELTEDVKSRLQATMDAAALIAYIAEVQLALLGQGTANKWWRHRAVVFGYVSGVSDGMAKSRGESSNWPGLLTCMAAINFLLKGRWDEQDVFDTCSRLTESGDPQFQKGAMAGFDDSQRLAMNGPRTGLIGALQGE